MSQVTNKTNKTEEKIKQVLSRFLGVGKRELVGGASFESDLNIGPIELKEAVNQVFKEFGIEEEHKFKTVGELINFIKDHLDEIEE